VNSITTDILDFNTVTQTEFSSIIVDSSSVPAIQIQQLDNNYAITVQNADENTIVSVHTDGNMYGYETNSSISNVTNSLRIGNVSSPTAPLSLSWNYNHHLFHEQNTANDAVISLDSGTGKCSAILFDSVYAGVDSANVFHIKQQYVARPVFLDSRNMLFIGNVFKQENAKRMGGDRCSERLVFTYNCKPSDRILLSACKHGYIYMP
jgi:hypothetical protein